MEIKIQLSIDEINKIREVARILSYADGDGCGRNLFTCEQMINLCDNIEHGTNKKIPSDFKIFEKEHKITL